MTKPNPDPLTCPECKTYIPGYDEQTKQFEIFCGCNSVRGTDEHAVMAKWKEYVKGKRS